MDKSSDAGVSGNFGDDGELDADDAGNAHGKNTEKETIKRVTHMLYIAMEQERE